MSVLRSAYGGQHTTPLPPPSTPEFLPPGVTKVDVERVAQLVTRECARFASYRYKPAPPPPAPPFPNK